MQILRCKTQIALPLNLKTSRVLRFHSVYSGAKWATAICNSARHSDFSWGDEKGIFELSCGVIPPTRV